MVESVMNTDDPEYKHRDIGFWSVRQSPYHQKQIKYFNKRIKLMNQIRKFNKNCELYQIAKIPVDIAQ